LVNCNGFTANHTRNLVLHGDVHPKLEKTNIVSRETMEKLIELFSHVAEDFDVISGVNVFVERELVGERERVKFYLFSSDLCQMLHSTNNTANLIWVI
jgi:hypothetical protein